MKLNKTMKLVVHKARALPRRSQPGSGKVFYSSPSTLFRGRQILLGYNPGGVPSPPESSISANIRKWPSNKGNDYVTEKWGKNKSRNTLQRRVNDLFDALEFDLDATFTSNLCFYRSRKASDLKLSNFLEYCHPVWQEMLRQCPARNILCIGVSTASEFVKMMKADEILRLSVPTIHPRANALLAAVAIGPRQYRIAAVPHLSRFNVLPDPKLIRRIKRHFTEN